VAVLAACGTPSSDLFIVDREGSLPGAKLSLKVGDGGTVTCDGKEREITSEQLLEAREIHAKLLPLLDDGLRLPARPGSQLSYRITGEPGTLRFADTSPGQPAVLGRLQRLTRAIAREACGRPR
jgi:hypothetical protein